MDNIIVFIIIYYLLGVIAQIIGTFITGKVVGNDGLQEVDDYVDDIGNFALLDILFWFINAFIVIYYSIIQKNVVLLLCGILTLLPPIKIVFSIFIVIADKINK